MNISEIKTYFETNKDNDEVKNYLMELNKVTTEGVEQFIVTDEGKKWISKNNDSFFTKGLETWKSNNLKKLIDEAVVKANPQETAEQKQIRELTERLNKKEADEQRQALLNRTLMLADEKKLPKDIVEHFLGNDDETTKQNIDKLESVFGKHVESLVSERLKGGYTPPKGGNEDATKTAQELFKQSLNG